MRDSPFKKPSWLGFIVLVLFGVSFLGMKTCRKIEYFRAVASLSKMPAEVAGLPGVSAREVILPNSSTDACWWILHTEDMISRGEWRFRDTKRDNAPAGREVHWSSGLMWLLAGLAWLIHMVSGLSVLACVQQAALIVGPLMHAVFTVVFACLAARRWGGWAGGVLGLAFATQLVLNSFFAVGEADHHGIVSSFAMGCVLAAAAAGAGRVAREGVTVAPHALVPSRTEARRWMAGSGLFGAAGLWVSAATMVPVLAGIALGALGAAWLARRGTGKEKTQAAPELWRLWGWSGALGSLAFYLIEYAPSHMGWRLEVNHPLFALAWWGAGELLARCCATIQGRNFAPTGRERGVAGLALLAVVALPLVIKIAGIRVFVISDPFLWNLHVGYIREFQPLLPMMAKVSWLEQATVVAWPSFVLMACWFLFRERHQRDRLAPLALALGAGLPTTALAIYQARWTGVAEAVWLVAITLCIACLSGNEVRSGRWLKSLAVLMVAAAATAFPALAIRDWRALRGRIGPDERRLLVARDVAWLLRKAAGTEPVNILSGPTVTTHLAFYGDTQSIGTLYWENLEGLKTAGRIYGARSEAEARDLCLQRKVTHIVVFSWDEFAQPYARLIHSRPVDAATDDCFVSSLLNSRTIPKWLRPIPYRMIPRLAKEGHWALILEVRPDQTEAEFHYYMGEYFGVSGQPEEELKSYLQSWNLDSRKTATGQKLGLALARAGRLEEAAQVAALLPPRPRFEIERAIGQAHMDAGRFREALATINRARELAPNDVEILTDLAWLLATAGDPAVRNGDEAIAIMDMVIRDDQPLTYRQGDAVAAAKAEAGDFPLAVQAMDKLIEAVKKDPSAQAMLPAYEARRAGYLLQRPYRQNPAPSPPQ